MDTESAQRLLEFQLLPEPAQEALLDVYEIALLATPAERVTAAEALNGAMTAVALVGGDDGIVLGRVAEHLIDVLGVASRDANRAQAQADRERLVRERITNGRS